MLKSMTGFGNAQAAISSIGRISVEIRSVNHKFLEIVSHLPEGFLSLEDNIKKAINSKIKRGRLTCVVNIAQPQASKVFINERLAKEYLAALRKMQRSFQLADGISLDNLINLPGILSLEQNNIKAGQLWPRLRLLLDIALEGLIRMRNKEGRVLQGHLKNRAGLLRHKLEAAQRRFKTVIAKKTAAIASEEERSSFLKDSDITEEIERLAFHIRNFIAKLSVSAAVGKELDFIAQEMQREANTIGAKSCDALISAQVIRIKSEIEKIREQVQNIE